MGINCIHERQCIPAGGQPAGSVPLAAAALAVQDGTSIYFRYGPRSNSEAVLPGGSDKGLSLHICKQPALRHTHKSKRMDSVHIAG